MAGGTSAWSMTTGMTRKSDPIALVRPAAISSRTHADVTEEADTITSWAAAPAIASKTESTTRSPYRMSRLSRNTFSPFARNAPLDHPPPTYWSRFVPFALISLAVHCLVAATWHAAQVALRQASDFAHLAASIKQAGLLSRRRGYYYVRISANLLVYAGAWVAFALLGDSWWQLAVAFVLAVMTTQLAFIGHDAGHKQIFTSRRWNDIAGYVHSGLVGVSYDWWVGKHSRHHANPNHEDEDPDVDISVLAFTQRQSAAKRGPLRWIAAHQAFLFFPLLLLEGFALHWHSIKYAGRER